MSQDARCGSRVTVRGTWRIAGSANSFPPTFGARRRSRRDGASVRVGVEQVPLHVGEQAETEEQRATPEVDAVGGAVAHHEVEGNVGDATLIA